ncbi:MAG: hypothetical protein ACOYBJ_02835 [Patescibacteria group bacterium]|jgi:hypothetical protein
MLFRPSRIREDWFAYLVSAAFSPYVVLPVLAVGVTWRLAPDAPSFLLWTSVTLFFLSLVPAAYITHRVRSGALTDIHIMVREQRSTAFLVFFLSGAVGIGVLWQLGASPVFLGLAGLVCANGFVAALVSLVWKISLHNWVLTGAITAFAILSGERWVWLLLLLVPFVIWARVARERHTVVQGVAGAVVGILLTACSYAIAF